MEVHDIQAVMGGCRQDAAEARPYLLYVCEWPASLARIVRDLRDQNDRLEHLCDTPQKNLHVALHMRSKTGAIARLLRRLSLNRLGADATGEHSIAKQLKQEYRIHFCRHRMVYTRPISPALEHLFQCPWCNDVGYRSSNLHDSGHSPNPMGTQYHPALSSFCGSTFARIDVRPRIQDG